MNALCFCLLYSSLLNFCLALSNDSLSLQNLDTRDLTGNLSKWVNYSNLLEEDKKYTLQCLTDTDDPDCMALDEKDVTSTPVITEPTIMDITTTPSATTPSSTTTTTTAPTTTTTSTTSTTPSRDEFAVSQNPSLYDEYIELLSFVLSRIYPQSSAATLGLFPYFVKLTITMKTGTAYCGGTLLSEAWILTAAQCVYAAQSISAEAGFVNASDTTARQTSQGIAIVHPSFKRNYMVHDIALVRLITPYTLNANVFPIKLPKRDKHGTELNYVTVKTMGYGAMSDEVPNVSDILYQVDLLQISKSSCNTLTKDIYVEYPPTTACLSTAYSTKGTCLYDAGGPVVYTYPNEVSTTLLGIMSIYQSCPSAYPMTYTRVAPYVQWIKSKVKNVQKLLYSLCDLIIFAVFFNSCCENDHSLLSAHFFAILVLGPVVSPDDYVNNIDNDDVTGNLSKWVSYSNLLEEDKKYTLQCLTSEMRDTDCMALDSAEGDALLETTTTMTTTPVFSEPILVNKTSSTVTPSSQGNIAASQDEYSERHPFVQPRIYPQSAAADLGLFPYFVKLTITVQTGTIYCGGSLLSETWVLTAAQCVYKAQAIVADAGIVDDTVTTSLQTSAGIATVHPGFKLNYMIHDIALVRLTKPYTLNANVYPIKLPKKDAHGAELNSVTVRTMGYGALTDNPNAVPAPLPADLIQSTKLYHVELVQMSKATCNLLTREVFVEYPPTTSCLSTSSSTKGTCLYDAGGPVVYTYPSEVSPTLLGVLSTYQNCPSAYPMSYTRVAPYVHWIRSKVKKLLT